MLISGDLEIPSIEFPDWTVQEFRTGSAAEINSMTREGFANQPAAVAGEFGAWLRPWAAGDTSTEKVNAILSQIVPGAAGESYTFKGWSKFEANYAGGEEFLDFTSPLDPGGTGTVPSPTDTLFEFAFLDAAIAYRIPVMLDLRTARGPTPNDITWLSAHVDGNCPGWNRQLRVSALMLDGVFNTNPSQSAFVDNFSLTGASAPATEKLRIPI